MTQAELDAKHLESIDCPKPGDDINLKTAGDSERNCELKCATGYYHKDFSEANPLKLTCEVDNESEQFGKTNLDVVPACYRAFGFVCQCFLWHRLT